MWPLVDPVHPKKLIQTKEKTVPRRSDREIPKLNSGAPESSFAAAAAFLALECSFFSLPTGLSPD
jgi:hypothetical protein